MFGAVFLVASDLRDFRGLSQLTPGQFSCVALPFLGQSWPDPAPYFLIQTPLGPSIWGS